MRCLLSLGSLALLLLPALGCSSESDAAAPGSVAAGCEQLVSSCLVDQKACVVGSDGPRCEPCPTGQFASDSGRCAPIPGSVLEHEFPPFTSQPGEEILDSCRSWTLGNDTELWVNAV